MALLGGRPMSPPRMMFDSTTTCNFGGNTPTCFVIQPFDGSKYDKRFEDIYRPAIEAAGLEAYRTDGDPAVEVPIDAIEEGIRDAALCLADITPDNPNMWYEPILEYFAATQSKGKGHWAETDSWCSAFVNWCVRQSGITGTRSATARSWLHWHQGEKLDQPRVGAVIVFPRPPNPRQGPTERRARHWDFSGQEAFRIRTPQAHTAQES